MRVCVRTCLSAGVPPRRRSRRRGRRRPSPALVKDSSGAVLPGVTVEAASPALIEKVRTTVDRRQRTVSHRRSAAGHLRGDLHAAWVRHLRRDGVLVGGTGVIAIDGELRVGGVQETDHRDRRNAGRRRPEHEARDHARQRNHAGHAGRPQLQLPAGHGSRVADQHRQRRHRSRVRDLPDSRWPGRRIASSPSRA